MIDRRQFLKTTFTAALGSMAAVPVQTFSRMQTSAGFFGIHEFIENNPDAVFIMRTHVDDKTNSQAIKQTALEFGRSVFVPKDGSGYPITDNVMIKPNITCRNNYKDYPGTEEQKLTASMGIITDAHFVEGVFESIKELGISGSQLYVRERSCPEHWERGGYTAMANRVGADLKKLAGDVTKGQIPEKDINWVDVPQGVWFRRIPYLWPVNADHTFMLNIAKFKTHDRGMTLTGKNFQGSIAYPYVQHCRPMVDSLKMLPQDLNPERETDILANYERHKEYIPRWKRPGTRYGSGQQAEEWATRCLDNHLASPNIALHIIEGVYGRDGNGFSYGPHDGFAQDVMTNVIIFGKKPFYVDAVGIWLAGHEPGNIGLMHMAKERGFIDTFNPMDIPVYEWKTDGSATLTPLSEFERSLMKMPYLTLDYDGMTEDEYHMVDEPFDYTTVSVNRAHAPVRPEAFVLHQNYPNPFNPYTHIQFELPHTGNVRLEILNSNGQLVDVLVDKKLARGSHMAIWHSFRYASGTYYYRLLNNGFSETKAMILLR